MAIEALDKKPFYQIIHSMLRHSGDEAEAQRSQMVMEWVARVRETLDKVCEAAEMRLIGLIWKAWKDHKSTPTRETLESLARGETQQGALMDLLNQYDEYLPILGERTQFDMDLVLAERVADSERRKLTVFLDNTRQIVSGRVENPDKHERKQKPEVEGVDDALHYLYKRLHTGVKVEDVRSVSGVVADNTYRLSEMYSRNQAARESGMMFIPTGIPLIDQHTGGMRRKEFNGVVGYTGQRKSAVLRTMGYHAARAGFKVIHIPLESDYAEEMVAYLVTHAHANAPEGEQVKISRQDFEGGNLQQEQLDLLLSEVREDFNATVGRNITLYEPMGSRTWVDVRAAIERECILGPVDLVLIDYLTLLKPADTSSRDKMSAVHEMIVDAKHLCMTANSGEGLSLFTPIQGSRKGYEDALKNEGAWTKDGIYMYSEFERSLDSLYYVFATPDMSRMNELKFGSCKMRRAVDIPPSFVVVNPLAGVLEPAAPEKDSIAKNVSKAQQRQQPGAHANFFGDF